MSIKPALVEHIFRGVWAAKASSNDGDAGDDPRRLLALDRVDSDGESTADDGDDSHARTSARVTKIHGDALILSSEFLRLFVEEALRRAQVEAMVDDSTTVEPHHVEQILAQLLLDF